MQANANYRYGFNGKEMDKDISEGGQDYGFRIYDGRLGRFLSVDPLTKSYPMLTAYQFSSNDPIESIDVDGLERQDYRLAMRNDGRLKLTYLSTGASTFKTTFLTFTVKEGIIPYFVRVEYNGRHYFFADGNLHKQIGEIPAAVAESTPPSILNYAADFDGFIKNPAAFAKAHWSYEEWLKNAKDIVDNVAVPLVAYLSGSETSPRKQQKSLQTPSAKTEEPVNNQTKAANSGNPQAANENTSNTNKQPKYFRGTESLEEPFKMSAADIRNSVDAKTHLMKEKGVSLNLDKNNKFVQQYGGAWEVDLSTLPKELKITHTNGTHYEITPQQGGTMTLERYQELLKQVKVKPANTVNN